MVHGVDQLLAPVSWYCSPGQLYPVPTIPLQVLVLPYEQHLLCKPTSFQWDYGPQIVLVCLEPGLCLFAGVFGVTRFKGISSSAYMQHDFLQHPDVLTLINDPWYVINMTNTIV